MSNISRVFSDARTTDTTAARVKAVIAADLMIDPATINDGSDLRADLGADSFDLWHLAMSLEAAFEIPPIEDAHILEAGTVGDVVKLVEGMVP